MKSLLLLMSTVFCLNTPLLAQNKIPPVDQSPLDISYYPENYPASKAQKKTIEPLIARVIYSRPAMNGRKIFGGLIEYGKVWRLGANEHARASRSSILGRCPSLLRLGAAPLTH